MTLVQITAPHFCAGVVAVNRKVTEAAPIVRYMLGWTGQQVSSYCRYRGWRLVKVPPHPLTKLPEQP